MDQTPVIYQPIPDSADHGAAFAALSPQQRAWVVAYLDGGCKSATQAAKQSGYGGDGSKPQSARMAGHRLKNDERILAAIKELAEKKVKTGAYIAMAVLLEVARNPAAKDTDRVKAAIEIANRSGMIVAQKVELDHNHHVDAKEAIAQIKAYAKELGLDERKLLGSAGYTDAEFELVSETRTQVPDAKRLTAQPATAMSSAGLEDLL